MDKYIVHLIFTVLAIVGIAVWDYATRFFSVPHRMDAMERRLKHDSLEMAKVKDEILGTQKSQMDSIASHREMLNQHEADVLYFYKKIK